jgi:hypothetical protein
MPGTQRYVSHELTHFVGRGKSEEEQYDLLVNKIIKAGWLMHPPYNLKEKAGWVIKFDALMSKNELVNPRMICFCDIPVADLSIHMAKYSRFALSFHKAFLIEKGANPVHYIAKNSITDGLSGRMIRAELYDQKVPNLLRSLVMMMCDFAPKPTDGTNKARVTSDTDPRCLQLSDINSFLQEEVFSLIKFFDDSKSEDDPENYYMEREWRVMGHVDFQIDDVYRVILPESFMKHFRKDLTDFNGQVTFAD